MELLQTIALGLGILFLVGANIAVWSWAWEVFAEARRDHRDKALLARVMAQYVTIREQKKQIERQRDLLEQQHAELQTLHGKQQALAMQLRPF